MLSYELACLRGFYSNKMLSSYTGWGLIEFFLIPGYDRTMVWTSDVVLTFITKSEHIFAFFIENTISPSWYSLIIIIRCLHTHFIGGWEIDRSFLKINQKRRSQFLLIDKLFPPQQLPIPHILLIIPRILPQHLGIFHLINPYPIIKITHKNNLPLWIHQLR